MGILFSIGRSCDKLILFTFLPSSFDLLDTSAAVVLQYKPLEHH